jgi:hypothetical protein
MLAYMQYEDDHVYGAYLSFSVSAFESVYDRIGIYLHIHRRVPLKDADD